jgi:UDP-MurNAc hydroxylase
MRLTFLRGACTILESGGTRLLTDPWLLDGVYMGAWAHYPPWSGGMPEDVDFIYISHIHPDHFDERTMAQFWMRKPPVLIHAYPTQFLRKRIEALGFPVIELPHAKSFDMGDMQIRIFSADGCDPAACQAFFGCAMPGVMNSQIDSLAVITDAHHTVVNVNDCPWALSRDLCRMLANDYPVIDLAMVAYAGAGPWPQCYAMPEEDKLAFARSKKRGFIDNVINFARALRAQRVFPFAGDYQLCGKLSELNERRGIPELSDVCRALWNSNIRTLCLGPGQTSEINNPGHPLEDHSEARLRYVADILSMRPLDYEAEPEPDQQAIVDLFTPAWQRFAAKREEFGLQAQATVYFPTGEKNAYFAIPPRGWPYFHERKDEPREPYVKITTDPRLLLKLLTGPQHAHWNNAEIGSHLKYERAPLTMYEPGLYHCLSYFHA